MHRKKATLAQKKARGDRGAGSSRYAQKVARRQRLAHDMGSPVAPLPVLEHGITEEELAQIKRDAELADQRDWLPPVDED